MKDAFSFKTQQVE